MPELQPTLLPTERQRAGNWEMIGHGLHRSDDSLLGAQRRRRFDGPTHAKIVRALDERRDAAARRR